MTACTHLTLLRWKLQVVFLLLSRKEPCGFLKLFDMTSYDLTKKFTSGVCMYQYCIVHTGLLTLCAGLPEVAGILFM